jgi:DNA-binding NarL/FixJ family response regulator
VGKGTVNTYVRRIYEKLHVRSRLQAVAKFSNFLYKTNPVAKIRGEERKP